MAELAPTDRAIRLARYAEERRGPFTLTDVARDLDWYGMADDVDFVDHDSTTWQTFRKAFIRDRDSLSDDLGIDLVATGDSYRLAEPFLASEPRRALIAAIAAVQVEGIDAAPAPGEVGAGLAAGAPPIRVHVDRLVALFTEAIRDRRAVRFPYRGTDRVVDPYAMGSWRGRWYLHGREHATDIVKNFALDRIDDSAVAAPTGEPGAFEPPGDLAADAVVQLDPNVWGTDLELDVRLVVDPDILPHLLAEFDGARDVGRVDDGRRVTLTVRHHRSFLARLLRFGDRVRLIEPLELRDQLEAWLRDMADA